MISRKNYTPTPVGSAVINADGSTSTCSYANYFEVYPVPSWQAGYVLQIHLKWGGSTGSNYYAISSYNTTDKTIFLNSSYLYLYSNNGSSNGSVGGLSLSGNTEYWIRLSWNGTVYTVEKSTDGETFTTVGSYSSSTALNTGKLVWFGRGNSNYSFGGIFYFGDTWLKDGDGKIIWSAAELVDASGDVSVTEGYYNSGTYILTPPFIKTSFRDLIDNQSIVCKNDLDLLDLGSSSYAYVLNDAGAPVGSYDHYQKVGDVYVSPGKDYLLGKTPGSLAFELDTGYVKNSNTGWTYNADTASTYHLYSTVSKDITNLFADQQKAVTNTLYLVNETKRSVEDSDFTPGVIAGTFTTALNTSSVFSNLCATTLDFAFFNKDGDLVKTHDGIHIEEVSTTLTNPKVTTNGYDKVFIYSSASNKYYYSINSGNEFLRSSNDSWYGITDAIMIGNFCIAYNGLHLYASSNFDDWTQLPYTLSQVSSITYANSHYLISCEGSTTAYVTDDFSTFTTVTLPGALNQPVVVFNDTFYAPVINAQFASSSDGVTWSAALGSALDTDMTVCGDFLYKKLSGVIYRTTDGLTWDACTGSTVMPRVALGADCQVCATKSGLIAYGKNATLTFTDISWAKDFSTSDYPYEIPTGFVVIGPTGLFVVNSTVKRSTITASSDPDNLSSSYVDYADSGYTVTLNDSLDTIVSVQEAS